MKRSSVLLAVALAGSMAFPAMAQRIYQGLDPQMVPRHQLGPASEPILVPAAEQRRLGLVTVRTMTGACSGTLLNQYWVLTAHHCIGQTTATGALLVPPVAAATVRVSAAWAPGTTVNPTRIEHFTNAARIANYADTTGHDLALLYLGAGDFGPVETDWYAKLWDGRTWGRRIPGSSNLDLYGRGISAWAFVDAAGNPQQSTSDGLYRIQRSLTAAGPSELWFVTSAVIAGGDSGGPSFLHIDTTSGTKTYLAGVHSFCSRATYAVNPLPAGWNPWQWTTYSLCGDQSVLPVVDAIRDFIMESPSGGTPTDIPFARSIDKFPFTLYYLVSRPPRGPMGIDPGETTLQQETYSWEGWDGPASYPLGIPRTGLKTIGTGWGNTVDVASIGGTRFLSRSMFGDLSWRHLIAPNPDGWVGPTTVGRNFLPFKRILGAEAGMLYAIQSNGDLYWYKYPRFLEGDGDEACPSLRPRDCFEAPAGGPFGIGAASVYPWVGPKRVGNGWGNFKHVFYAGNGVIYAVKPNGNLLWYRHEGQLEGRGRWRRGSGLVVGEGWGQFRQIASVGNGGIVALRPDGELVWYRHKTWNADLPGERRYSEWEGPIRIRTGLENILAMFVETDERIYRGPN